MSSKPTPRLSSANPYLRDPAVRERTVLTSVATSTAIEGIRAPFRPVVKAAVGSNVPRQPVPRKKP